MKAPSRAPWMRFFLETEDGICGMLESPAMRRKQVIVRLTPTHSKGELEPHQTNKLSKPDTVLGPDETNARLDWMSIDSPLTCAALKRRLDDEFEAELSGGRTRFLFMKKICLVQIATAYKQS
ncbi:GreA/GreB family elongation factor [Rhodanobacter sp. DHG33]|nr:GreA/GreB family elongation factor [Rhodanobacter sp. DHG33]